MPGELLLAGSATAMIANGVVMVLSSRIWSHGTVGEAMGQAMRN